LAREDAPLGFLLSLAVRLFHQRSHELMGDTQLHPGQMPIMFALWRDDGQAQKDLARRLNLAPATVTVTVNRLERAGILERRKDPEDQRVSRVYLTERGRDLHDTVVACLRATNEEALTGFTPEETDQLKEYLSRIIDNLEGAMQHRARKPDTHVDDAGSE
jgi:DNA-binding MarR family transcriptional regulator